MSNDLHDYSRVDAWARSRQRAAFLHAVWRPMLAGAAGAALVVAAVYVTLPKFSYRDIEIPRVVLKDLPLNNPIPRDMPFDVPVPRVAPPPVAANPPAPWSDAPRTAEEQKFHDRPEYRDAIYSGRIVKSRNGHDLSFADGKDFAPGHWDDAAGKVVYDPEAVIPSDQFIGDLGRCSPNKAHADADMWDCTAMHNGVEVHVSGEDNGRPVKPQSSIGSTPTLDATSMINVDVDIGYRVISAEVDSGCSWPMALPKSLADELLTRGLATRAGSSKAELADGSKHDIDIIMIKAITVEGRVLNDVEASVTASPAALVLLGLAALERLGAFTIEDGRIVFSGDPT